MKATMKSGLILMVSVLFALSVQAELPRVVVLGTGGTIQSKGDTRMTRHDYRSGRYDIAELIDALPEVHSIARVEATQFTNVGSPNLTMSDWIGLATRIDEMAANDPGIAGFVVTHGTNTMEETAYFLHLVLKTDRPVVLVGAQRPATSISGDGPLNLYNAILLAGRPEARGLGVMIAMNQQIGSAREVTKSSTYKVQAFQSGDLGQLGVIDPDGVQLFRKPTRRHTFLSEFHAGDFGDIPRVEVVDAYIEARGDIVDYLVSEGVHGIVIAGHGGGGMSPAQTEAVTRAVEQGTVVVVASRTGTGRVIETSRHREMGVITGDNLLPHKARILLQVALASGRTKAAIHRAFETY